MLQRIFPDCRVRDSLAQEWLKYFLKINHMKSLAKRKLSQLNLGV